MKISPFIFFLIKEGSLILWDYKAHNQFKITNAYLEELRNISSGGNPLNQDIFSELVENNIIVNDEDPRFSDANWEWDDLSKIFHIGTQDIPQESLTASEYSKNYLEECEKYFSKTEFVEHKKDGSCTKLPTSDFSVLNESNFLKTLRDRHTSRSFNKQSVEIEKISTLMELTFSSSKRDNKYFNSLNLARIGERKTSPSGGALHPSKAYLYSHNIKGLDRGIYNYNTKSHGLARISSINNDLNLGAILNNQYFANDLSAGIFITSDFRKQWWKYKHSRAYRVALLDVGFISQTLLLTATALGLSTWVSAAFNDTEVSKLLGIDCLSEKPILFVGFGYGSGSPVDPETIKILNYDKNKL